MFDVSDEIAVFVKKLSFLKEGITNVSESS